MAGAICQAASDFAVTTLDGSRPPFSTRCLKSGVLGQTIKGQTIKGSRHAGREPVSVSVVLPPGPSLRGSPHSLQRTPALLNQPS